jgi:hypothetical protein
LHFFRAARSVVPPALAHLVYNGGSDWGVRNARVNIIVGRTIMSRFRFSRIAIGLMVCAGALFVAQHATAQAGNPVQAQSSQSFRTSFGQLLDSYDQVFRLSGNVVGQQSVAQARAAMLSVSDAEFARTFALSGTPDVSPAVSAIQRIATMSQRNKAIQSVTIQTEPFPSAPAVIDSCSPSNTPHSDQSTYDALIAFQVTSGILAAAAWVCNEDILGENGSAACIPLAIANDIASSLFAVRSFCAGLDTASTVLGNYDRLDHIHTDLTNARADIINNANSNTTAITSSISAALNSIISNANANTTTIVNNANSNTTSIMNNDNTNRDMIISQLQALGCEIVRLLNTPDGLKASSIEACKAQPGFPYSWNKR